MGPVWHLSFSCCCDSGWEMQVVVLFFGFLLMMPFPFISPSFLLSGFRVGICQLSFILFVDSFSGLLKKGGNNINGCSKKHEYKGCSKRQRK